MNSHPTSGAARLEDVRTTVILLALAAFFSGVAFRICDGLLPRFASDFSISAGTAGQVVLTFSVAYSLMQLLFGPLGDRFGKARMVGWALAGCALASAAASLAASFDLLLVARAGWGMAAAGVVPLAMAWIGDNVPYEERQATLARLLLGTLTGMTAGQLAGGLFGDAGVGWRGAFLSISLGYFLIAGLLAWRFSRMAGAAPASPTSQGASGQGGAPTTAGGAVLRSFRQTAGVLAAPWNRRVLAASLLEGVFLLGPMAFVPALLHHRFGLSLSVAAGLIALYAVGGLVYALLARRLVRALGERRMVLAGGWLMGLGLAAWWLSPVAWTAAPVALLVGFGTYLYHNTLQTLATQMAPQARGTAVSLFAFSLFFGQAVGVAAAGWAFDRWGAVGLLSSSVLALPVVGWSFSRALARRATIVG